MSTDNAFVSVRPQINIAGTENSDLAQALTAMEINLPLTGVAHAEITVSNWIATAESADFDYGFESIGLGESIEVLIADGNGGMQRLFKGEVTALEERYGEGAPQLSILAQDKLHRLTRTRNNRVFEEQSLDDVISTLASGAGLTADANLSSVVATYHQLNESDMAFLIRVTGNLDVAARLENDYLRVKPEETDANPIALNAQDSALKICLIADLNHQPISVMVKGYNLDNDEEVTEQCDALGLIARDKSAAATLKDLGWDGEEIVPQPYPRSQGEAEAFAKGHFNRAAKRFIRGDIQAIGEPRLSSGREIELSGVSPRFSGRYHIVNCVHHFTNTSGFETHLKINKADWRP